MTTMADDKKPTDDSDRKQPPAEKDPPAKPERPKPDTLKSFHGSDDQSRRRRDRD
jgi:hypothetical protein